MSPLVLDDWHVRLKQKLPDYNLSSLIHINTFLGLCHAHAVQPVPSVVADGAQAVFHLADAQYHVISYHAEPAGVRGGTAAAEFQIAVAGWQCAGGAALEDTVDEHIIEGVVIRGERHVDAGALELGAGRASDGGIAVVDAEAGLGIAFHAKPRVVANAKQSINTIGLDGVLYFLGFKDSYLGDQGKLQ